MEVWEVVMREREKKKEEEREKEGSKDFKKF